MAAEIVFHAHTTHRGGPPTPFTPATPFGVPPLPPPAPVQQQPMPALSNPPNVANMITSLDGSTLQSLLSALQPRPAVPTVQPQPFPPPNTPQTTAPADLASLLNTATRPPVANPPAHIPAQPFPVQAPNAPMVTDPSLLSLLSKGLGGQQPQNQAPVGPHVQNIIKQLTKWKQ